MELTFKRRNHYGITVWESNETVLDIGIEFPRFRIVKEDNEFVVREKDPEKCTDGYGYSSNTVHETKLKDTIYWLNINLHRI
jgi:hypothetical protein